MEHQKITVFAGHYGSGKTNLAVNYALHLREISDQEISVCDLDIVNPYFRTKDSERLLEEQGIRMIASEFANSNVDLPSVPSAAYSIFASPGYSVVDLGGDDRGAYALGRFADLLTESDSWGMYLVVNSFRPDPATPELALTIMEEIQAACHIRFTGVVNNSNLGKLTTAEMVEGSVDYANRICELTGLPLIMTTYEKSLGSLSVPNPFPITIYTKDIWQI